MQTPGNSVRRRLPKCPGRRILSMTVCRNAKAAEFCRTAIDEMRTPRDFVIWRLRNAAGGAFHQRSSDEMPKPGNFVKGRSMNCGGCGISSTAGRRNAGPVEFCQTVFDEMR